MSGYDLTEYRHWLREHRNDPQVIASGQRLARLLRGTHKGDSA